MTSHNPSRILWLQNPQSQDWETSLVRSLDTHTHTFNGPLSRTTRVGRYQKGKTNLDFTEARDSEWQWHQLGHMQVCTSLQTDNHASTPPLIFLQAGCPSCCPTDSVEALKALDTTQSIFTQSILCSKGVMQRPVGRWLWTHYIVVAC